MLKKMLKKYLSYSVLGAVLLGLTGCGGTGLGFKEKIPLPQAITKQDVSYKNDIELKKLREMSIKNKNIVLIKGLGSYNVISDIHEGSRKKSTQLSLLNQAALGAKYVFEKKGFKVLYPIALRDAKITSLDIFIKKCQSQFTIKSCGDVFSDCNSVSSGKSDSGMIIVEYTNENDNTTTYFDAETLMNNLKKNYEYFDNPTKKIYINRMNCLKNNNIWCCQDTCYPR